MSPPATATLWVGRQAGRQAGSSLEKVFKRFVEMEASGTRVFVNHQHRHLDLRALPQTAKQNAACWMLSCWLLSLLLRLLQGVGLRAVKLLLLLLRRRVTGLRAIQLLLLLLGLQVVRLRAIQLLLLLLGLQVVRLRAIQLLLLLLGLRVVRLRAIQLLLLGLAGQDARRCTMLLGCRWQLASGDETERTGVPWRRTRRLDGGRIQRLLRLLGLLGRL
jgi:hypothetical protein